MNSDTFDFQWHITDTCNLRCRHCYQEQFISGNELDLSALKLVTDKICSYLNATGRKTVINVTGGEPLLKDELHSFLTYLDNCPVSGRTHAYNKRSLTEQVLD